VGAVLPLAGTIVEKLLTEGRSIGMFDDIAASAHDTLLARSRGWHALLMSTFAVAGTTYVLTFVHAEPNTDPFDALDYTYLQLITSFFVRNAQRT
jgi:hypothetical protein